VADWLEAGQEKVVRVDLPLIGEGEMLDRLRSVEPAAVISFLEERKEQIFSGIWDGVLGLGRGIGSFVTILGYLVPTPVLTFYLLRDRDGLKDRIAGLLLLQFPYAVLLGVLVAVFSVVPYLGLVLSLIPAVFIALVSGSVLLSLVKIAVVYGATQALEAAVISPRIVGESVGLHPVSVVLALSLGGFFFGFVGVLLAVPLAVGVKLLVVRGVDRYRNSDFFQGVSGAEE
jgi:predicted PurR-regulated permease PerM